MSEERSITFKADLNSPMQVLYKDDDRMVIWGPASVEVVDKEDDKITAEALKSALPQLLRRKRLSLEHSDQLVGDILEEFETDEPKTVEIDGHQYERKTFPTDVLESERDEVPKNGLYVAGEIYNDSRQAKDTRENIEQGIINSYSISGEAIQNSTRVKEGRVVNEINDMDLSAVTLCEDGMNQEAKFAVIAKRDFDIPDLAGKEFNKAMAEEEEEEEEEENPSNATEAEVDKQELREEFKTAASEVLDGRNLASKDDLMTREDVEEIVAEKIEDDDDDEEPEMPPEEDEPLVEDEPPIEDEPPVEDEPSLDEEEDDLPIDDEEETIESAHNIPLDELKSKLPDELYRAVSEHLSDPGEGQIAAADEDEDDEPEADDDEEEEGDVSKSLADEIEGTNVPFNARALDQESIEKEDEGDGERILNSFYEEVEG